MTPKGLEKLSTILPHFENRTGVSYSTLHWGSFISKLFISNVVIICLYDELSQNSKMTDILKLVGDVDFDLDVSGLKP